MYFQVAIDSFSKKQLATLSSKEVVVFAGLLELSDLWSPIRKMHEQVQDTIISVKKYKER